MGLVMTLEGIELTSNEERHQTQMPRPPNLGVNIRLEGNDA
jgi:hypothetical protein